jgi:hypothetical protein
MSTAKETIERGPIRSRDLHAQVHGSGVLGQFNTWLAVLITKRVGTMWAAYIFAALTVISLPAAIQSRSPIVIVAWIAQTFLQLVLLPIIIVGQNVIQAHNDERAEADHAILSALHDLNLTQLAILRRLEAPGSL